MEAFSNYMITRRREMSTLSGRMETQQNRELVIPVSELFPVFLLN